MGHAAVGISGGPGLTLRVRAMHTRPALSLSAPRRVAVLGAGIVGLSTAWQLQRDGLEVTVVDRGQPGQGAGFGNGAQPS